MHGNMNQPEGFIVLDYINGKVNIVTGCEIYRREFITINALRFKEGVACHEDTEFRIKKSLLREEHLPSTSLFYGL